MVLGHVLPEKNESLLDAYEKCRAHADAKACCDYALHVAVTWWSPKVHIFTERQITFMCYDITILYICTA